MLSFSYLSTSLNHLDTALTYAHAWHDKAHVDIADVHMYKGVVFSKLMRLDASTTENLKALKIYESLFGKESSEVAGMYMHLGVNYYKQDEFEASESCFARAKSIFERTLQEEDENWNRIYNNMGMLYRKKKDYTRSLEYAKLALSFKLKHYDADHPSVGKYYSNLFRVYRDMGELDQAAVYNKKLMEVALGRYGKDHPAYASSLSELAGLSLLMGKPREAYDLYEQAQNIHQARMDPNHPYGLTGYSNRAMCLSAMGDLNGAIRLMKQAIKGNQSNDEKYFPHLFDDGIYLASLYKQNGDYKKAQHLCDSLLGILLQRSQKPNAIGFSSEYKLLKLKGLHERGHIKYMAAQNENTDLLQQSSNDYAAAIDLSESIQRELSFDELQTSYFDRSTNLFNEAVEAHLAVYKSTNSKQALLSAIAFSEQSKSMLLRRNLQEKDARRFASLPEETLRDMQRIEDEIFRLKSSVREIEVVNKSDSADLITQALVALKDEKEGFIRKLEDENPVYFNIKYAKQKLNFDHLQQKLKDSKSACLAYYFLDQKGVVFYISANQIRSESFIWNDSIRLFIQSLQSNDPSSIAAAFNKSKSQYLYQALWHPIDGYLKEDNINRIVISPHQELNYLPFDLLCTNTPSAEWLVSQYAISYIQSLSSFENEVGSEKEMNYAGFAPVFDNQNYQPTMLASRSQTSPLPASIDEVTLGSELFEGQTFIRSDANRKSFMEVSKSANILHIASHATIKPTSIRQSGIQLYPNENSTSIFNEDWLSLADIYNLKLNAGLVILSACNTGAGELSKSEGPLSMSRAFQYAGGNSVVMSHWRANDNSTAEIVKSFLRELKKGHPKDIALQKAKKNYLASSDEFMSHPFFWASLSLYGNASTIEVNSRLSIWIYAGCVLVLILLLLRFRKMFLITE